MKNQSSFSNFDNTAMYAMFLCYINDIYCFSNIPKISKYHVTTLLYYLIYTCIIITSMVVDHAFQMRRNMYMEFTVLSTLG